MPSLVRFSKPYTRFSTSESQGCSGIPLCSRTFPNEVLNTGSERVENTNACHNVLLVPLPSFGFSVVAKEIQ